MAKEARICNRERTTQVFKVTDTGKVLISASKRIYMTGEEGLNEIT